MTTRSASPPSLLSLAGFVRWTPEQYHRMIESGLLQEGEPIELLEGFLVEKAMRNPPHEAALRRLSARVPKRLPAGWFLQVQGAVALGDSEPEPDGAVLRGDETTCDGRLPGPGDVELVIEVADSTLAFDRRDKGRIYARAGIPVYWIVNVADAHVEVYTNPDPTAAPPAYQSRADYRPGQDVPVVLDGAAVAQIPAAELLP